jgi:hypothetical protein
LTNHGEASCPTQWDTNGQPLASRVSQCDIPNWFYYGFRGSLSVGTDFSDPSWTRFLSWGPVERPARLRTDPDLRGSCAAPAYLPKPSCEGASDSARGDWVETVAGGPTPSMLAAMHAFIDRYGRQVRGAEALGKAVVVNIFMWDCAERFDSRAPRGDQWDLVVRRSEDEDEDADCSAIRPRDARTTSIDRVHLFTVVPFTFYDTLITSASVQAFWGDAFGDAGICQSIPLPSTAECQLNPLMNSAFLVPDE